MIYQIARKVYSVHKIHILCVPSVSTVDSQSYLTHLTSVQDADVVHEFRLHEVLMAEAIQILPVVTPKSHYCRVPLCEDSMLR